LYAINDSLLQVKNQVIVEQWFKESLYLTRNCVGFSAPVASRTFAYISIVFYECNVESSDNNLSLSGQLKNFKRNTWLSNHKNILWPHAFNYAGYKATQYFYSNMPPDNKRRVKFLYDSLSTTYVKELKMSTKKCTEGYIDSLLADIYAFAEKDGGHLSFNTNFPSNYIVPSCDSCWTKTTPGYLNALQPFWGNQVLFFEENKLNEVSTEYPHYSTDTMSTFYKDAKEIYDYTLSTDPQFELIAEYWDDAPGYSGTPTGHLLSIALQLSKAKKLNLSKSLQLYVLLTISIKEAFITCWYHKYNCNLIRPITYIHRHISPDFNTIIPTPPFPEFPSGHSMQSAAACEVFKLFFSDTLSFIDSTNLYRRDINGSVRKFNNFSELSNEISISRLYGGIHYRTTLTKSLKYGEMISRNCISKIQFTK